MNGKQSKAQSHLLLQVLGLGYVAYLMFSLISDFLSGKGETSLLVFCLIIAGLAVAEVALGWFAFQSWKRDRKAEQNAENKS
jgi:hypothetical protein